MDSYIHYINLILDIFFGGIAFYRLHRGGLLESGTTLRVGIILLAGWRAFGDLHYVTGNLDWWEIHYDPFRNMVSEMILLIAVLFDSARDLGFQRAKR